jgi:spermidine synthase
VLLGLPAAALGATFPVAARWYVTGSAHPVRAAGHLYVANTAGAATGALGAGFFLIPTLGVAGTVSAGIAATLVAILLVTIVAWQTRRGLPALATSGHGPAAETPPGGSRKVARRTGRSVAGETSVERPLLAAVLLGLTGFSTFSLEVAWTRTFSLLFGPTTYAFASTVTGFIAGLALGAGLGSALAARIRRHGLALSVLLAGAAIAGGWACASAGTTLPRQLMREFAGSTEAWLPSHLLLMAWQVLPTAIGIGAAFPLALEVAGPGRLLTSRLGTMYAVNTLGAVAGSLSTGFLLIPVLGLQRTLQLGLALPVVGALVVVFLEPWQWSLRARALVPALAALALLATMPPWNRELLASGAYKYAPEVPKGLDLEAALTAGTLIYDRDGSAASVTVKRLTGDLSLAIDGKIDASTTGDMLTQKLLAHLPLLLHENPRQVNVIGLGSGATAASALTHPIDSIDIVEISPEVVEASRLFAQDGRSPLDDPRARLVVGDGRTHLTLTSQAYDVIISEPSNPWMAGVAALFTHEFFASARSRLRPGGILCQWAHTYDISVEDLRSIVATFAAEFPGGTMWLVGEGDLLLIGSTDAVEPRLPHVSAHWSRPGVAEDLRGASVMEPFGLLSLYAGGPEALARFAAGASLQHDDRMALEFSGPRSLRRRGLADIVAMLRALQREESRPAVVARAWAEADARQLAHRGAMLRRAGSYAGAYDAFAASAGRDPAEEETLAGLVETASVLGRKEHATGFLQGLVSAQPTLVAPRVALSKLHAASGETDAAVRAATEAAALGPGDPTALEQLASIFADLGDSERLAPVADALARQFPTRPGTHYYAGARWFLAGRLPEALVEAERTLELDAGHARAQNLAGAINARMGRSDAARAAFEAALRLNARDPATYQNLGLLELSAGNRAAAGRLFAEALSLDPTSDAARQGLAQAGAPTAR